MTKDLPENIKIALEAAAESAQRCRWTILVLVTASVLAFMASWNSLDRSWIRIRQARLDDAVDHWASASNTLEFSNSMHFVEAKFKMGALYGGTNSNATNLFSHLKRLRNDIDQFQNHEVRYVRIAFFGIGFDVNDLGVFSGIGFSILLIILAFSLKREVRNLKFFFELTNPELRPENRRANETKDYNEIRRLGYNLLAMRQVLTLPPVAQGADSSIALGWRLLQWGPFIMPVLIQLTILVEDFTSFDAGQAWDPHRALLLIAYDSAAVVLVGIFTYICISERHLMNVEWNKAYREAYHENEIPGITVGT